MWIAKGTLLALWLFGFGTLTFFYFAVYRNLSPGFAVDIRIITGYTIQNPLWWAALVVCLVLGYAIARSWSGPPILWVTLLITGLVPAGFFALLIYFVYKLNQFNRGIPP